MSENDYGVYQASSYSDTPTDQLAVVDQYPLSNYVDYGYPPEREETWETANITRTVRYVIIHCETDRESQTIADRLQRLGYPAEAVTKEVQD